LVEKAAKRGKLKLSPNLVRSSYISYKAEWLEGGSWSALVSTKTERLEKGRRDYVSFFWLRRLVGIGQQPKKEGKH
jgi:hypothetical protein